MASGLFFRAESCGRFPISRWAGVSSCPGQQLGNQVFLDLQGGDQFLSTKDQKKTKGALTIGMETTFL